MEALSAGRNGWIILVAGRVLEHLSKAFVLRIATTECCWGRLAVGPRLWVPISGKSSILLQKVWSEVSSPGSEVSSPPFAD